MERVGFIGVGAMGLPLVKRMLDRGIAIQAFDQNPDALAAAVEAGASAAQSAREIADSNEIVFACLPNPEICMAVALGKGGISDGEMVKIYVEMSTLGGAVASEMAQKLSGCGITMIDSPVVGGAVALNAGTVGVLVAGQAEAFARVRFALDALGGRLFYLGETVGAAQAGKVMNNAVAFAAFMATCEAVAIGMKAGIGMETAVAIINQGSGKNFFSELIFTGFILKGRYDGTGAMEIGVKDVKLFLEEAQRLDVPTPMATHVSAVQHDVLAAGPAGRDTLTAFHYFTDLAGLPRQG